MKQVKSTKIVMNYLAYFLLMLLIPVIVMSVIYFRVVDIVTLNTYDQNLAAMKTGAQTIEKNFDDLGNLSFNIAQNSQMNRFFALDSINKDMTVTSQVYEAQKDLRSFTIANNMIGGIQLYSSKANLLIDSHTSAMAFERYYDNIFAVEGYSLWDWREEILPGSYQAAIFPARMIRFNSTSKRRVLYAQSVPFPYRNVISGNIFIYMDEDEILNLFQAIPYRTGGFLSIFDKNGALIALDNSGGIDLDSLSLVSLTENDGYDIQSIRGEEMLVIYLNDSHYQLSYVAAIPREQILKPTVEIRFFLSIMIIITLAGGVILAFLYAYKTSKPIVSLYRHFVGMDKKLSPNDLGDEIAELVKRNADLKDLVRLQLPIQQMSFVYSLLVGGFREAEELKRHFGKLGISLEADHFAVFVISLTDLNTDLTLQEIGIYKELIKEFIGGHFSGFIGMCDIDLERIAFLIGFTGEDEETLRRRLADETEQIAGHFLERIGISLFFAGSLVEGLTEIPSAFSDVQSAAYSGTYGSRQHIQWCDRHGSGDSFYYPDNFESRLVLAVQEGKTSMLLELLEMLERRNDIILSGEDSQAGYHLTQMMYSTLLKSAKELPGGNDAFLQKCSTIAFDMTCGGKTAREIFRLFGECFATAASLNADSGNSSGALRARILEYVDGDYMNPQISLASVAHNFKITEVYLSRIFKQITGENFSRHIEKLRMEHANKLMKTGEHGINKIASMVGYNSPQVFRRAYKRCFGILPSEFKKRED